MSFNPSAVNYQQQISAFERGEARKNQAEKERMARQAEIDKKKASKRSPFEKLVSAGLRGAAAYYTGGLSETLGGGKMIDSVMLGEGAERNEFGDMVGLASGLGTAMSAKSAGDVAKNLASQSLADDKMQSRLDTIAATGTEDDKMAAFDFARKRRQRDEENRKRMQEYKDKGFLGAFSKPENIDYGKINYVTEPSGAMPEPDAPQLSGDYMSNYQASQLGR
tara:strand:- start:11415 stop:12080 length:666 start_codon:yes stop_codon:yes gene_type:complete